MELYFTKMHGTGNDFLVIDDLSADIELTSEQVSILCDRHFGVGADGLILVRPPINSGSTAFMHYVNADGSLAEMCGNGIRCFAKWLVDKGFVKPVENIGPSRLAPASPGGGRFVADTRAGARLITFEVDAEGLLSLATVDMGEAALAPEAIPTTLGAVVPPTLGAAAPATTLGAPSDATTLGATPPTLAVLEAALPTTLGEARFTCVKMGNPHAVSFDVPVWDISDSDFARLGAPLEGDTTLFPEGCNIEFVELLNPAVEPDAANLRMRVFERGVGETLACGTGASAVAVAAALTGRAGRVSRVRLRGGLLHITWRDDNHVLLTGPATTVFEGTIAL
jgi:diaminopimelate epimerase